MPRLSRFKIPVIWLLVCMWLNTQTNSLPTRRSSDLRRADLPRARVPDGRGLLGRRPVRRARARVRPRRGPGRRDRKSTRLNSSHVENSYAVFCLKKKTVGFYVAKHVNKKSEMELGGK